MPQKESGCVWTQSRCAPTNLLKKRGSHTRFYGQIGGRLAFAFQHAGLSVDVVSDANFVSWSSSAMVLSQEQVLGGVKILILVVGNVVAG